MGCTRQRGGRFGAAGVQVRSLLRRVRDGGSARSGVRTEIRGKLGLDFHPDYASNGHLYVNFTNSIGTTIVRRYSVSGDPDLADAASATAVLDIGQPQGNHNGGWLAFGPEGFLYIATGDGGGSHDSGASSPTI